MSRQPDEAFAAPGVHVLTGWPPRRWRVVEYSPVFGYITKGRHRTRAAARISARAHRRRGVHLAVMTHAEQEYRNTSHDAHVRGMSREEWTDALAAERALARRLP